MKQEEESSSSIINKLQEEIAEKNLLINLQNDTIAK